MTDELAAYERRFRRAGLPLLSEDFSARSDVFNHAFRCSRSCCWPSCSRRSTSTGRREEFLEEITAQLRDTFAARTEYLELRASAHAPGRP